MLIQSVKLNIAYTKLMNRKYYDSSINFLLIRLKRKVNIVFTYVSRAGDRARRAEQPLYFPVKRCRVKSAVMHQLHVSIDQEPFLDVQFGRVWRGSHTLFPQKRISRARPCFFFFTLVTGPRRSVSLKLSDTRVYAP